MKITWETGVNCILSVQHRYVLRKRGKIWWIGFNLNGKNYYISTKERSSTEAKKAAEKIYRKICVAKNTKTETRKSVWHPAEEEPKIKSWENSVRLVLGIKQPDRSMIIRSGRFYRVGNWREDVIEGNIEKWAYFDEMMGL